MPNRSVDRDKLLRLQPQCYFLRERRPADMDRTLGGTSLTRLWPSGVSVHPCADFVKDGTEQAKMNNTISSNGNNHYIRR